MCQSVKGQLTHRFREQARSHSGFAVYAVFVHGAGPGEPSLLAIAVAHSTWVQADTPPSRAGSLPQWVCGVWGICARRGTGGSRACSR
ncbi:protein of unknown function [Pseudomonas mediterranea]